jgi:HprK-related kinase A
VIVNTGLYSFELGTFPNHLESVISTVYQDAEQSDVPIDFSISLRSDSIVRRVIKPQITFYCDVHAPFKPLPSSQAYALLEWGMNWCVAAHDFSRLIVHAAVLVKNDQAIIFPAAPGSGKSTLTAYLSLNGWTLYSDEMAIIDLDKQTVSPLYRPVCLKNDSISIIQSLHPDAIMTPVCKDTQKGDVSHLKGIDWQSYQQLKPVDIVGIVFPKYKKEVDLTIYTCNQLQAFESLSKHAFNYTVLGQRAFETVSQLTKDATLFEVEYNSLPELAAFLSEDVIR